ncbi:hypothetical protein BCF46_1627 [Litoreibacter meonggei]|uniref:DUF1737 domain-containing protein n=2 Tax=Litoreibacter meonggei TaxID=1049199 RepID=A0A497WYR3_9RHOB|nr:hypothetical protein BCF46_1627 [Litoreibacter meonggei]
MAGREPVWGRVMKIYRLLTEDDTSAFCHKVSDALSKGWELYGDPTYAFDASNGVMRCGQAVTKEIEGSYSPDMKLGAQ